jgi:hypothetical protein
VLSADAFRTSAFSGTSNPSVRRARARCNDPGSRLRAA